jgi:hypothetical protein
LSSEIAEWGPKLPRPFCNDPMYVLVYDVHTELDEATAEKFPDCIQADGFARTAYFMKFDEFINW